MPCVSKLECILAIDFRVPNFELTPKNYKLYFKTKNSSLKKKKRNTNLQFSSDFFLALPKSVFSSRICCLYPKKNCQNNNFQPPSEEFPYEISSTGYLFTFFLKQTTMTPRASTWMYRPILHICLAPSDVYFPASFVGVPRYSAPEAPPKAATWPRRPSGKAALGRWPCHQVMASQPTCLA